MGWGVLQFNYRKQLQQHTMVIHYPHMIFSEIFDLGAGQLRRVPYIAQVHLINIVFCIAPFKQ